MEGNPIRISARKSLEEGLDTIIQTIYELNVGDDQLVVITSPGEGGKPIIEIKKAGEIIEMYNKKPNN